MEQLRAKILAEVGLHARPAAQFVATAKKHAAKVRVRNATADGKWVDAKSILGVLALAASRGTRLEVTADGPDEEAALAAVRRLFESHFGEES